MTLATVPGRLRWRCRRGMQELDRLLLSFLERGWADASSAEKVAFEELLTAEDADLWHWFSGQRTPPIAEHAALVQRILDAVHPDC